MRRKDLLKVEELEKLNDRELIMAAVQNWDHLKPFEKELATRLENYVNQLASLAVSVFLEPKENPDGNDPGRKSKISG